jgi:acetyl esterase/lipase
MRALVHGLAALLLSACSAVDVLNATAERTGIDIASYIPYADGERRTLDIYRPRDAANAPLCVFYYGGGWESGAKESYLFVASALAARGIVTIVPDYRVYPEVRLPDFLNDAASAARWAKDHAQDYGADPNRVVLAGHSAGAHIAAMLALDKQWLDAVGLSPRDLAGMSGIAGPYDFLPLTSETLKTIFGPESERPRTQPINFVDGTAPPMQLLTGALDLSVDPGNTTRLAAKIAGTGGLVETRTYRFVGHALVLGALAPPLRLFAPTLDDMERFIKSVPPTPERAVAHVHMP